MADEYESFVNPGYNPDPAKSVSAANAKIIPERPAEEHVLIRNVKQYVDAFANYNTFESNLTVSNIRNALSSADDGYVESQAELFRNVISHDSVIAAHLSTRYLSVLAKEWTIQGGSNSEKRKEVSEVLKSAGINRVMRHLLQAIPYGYSGCTIDWSREQINFTFVDPANWRFTPEGGISILNSFGEEFPITYENSLNFVFHTYGYCTGIPPVTGLLRILVWTYFFKQIASRHKARFLEKFGIPQLIMKISETDFKDSQMLARLKTQMQNIGADGVGITTSNADVQPLQVSGSQSNNGEFLPWIKYHDDCATLTILGQLATSGDAGGLSKGQAQENVRNDITEADCYSLAETITNMIVKPYEKFKWGTDELSFNISAKPQADITSVVNQIKALEEIGYSADEDWIEKTLGIPVKKKENAKPINVSPVSAPQAPAPEAAAPAFEELEMPQEVANAAQQTTVAEQIQAMSPAAVLGATGENPAQLSDARLLRRGKLLAFSDANPQLEEDIRDIISNSNLTAEIKASLSAAPIDNIPSILEFQRDEAEKLQVEKPEFSELVDELESVISEIQDVKELSLINAPKVETDGEEAIATTTEAKAPEEVKNAAPPKQLSPEDMASKQASETVYEQYIKDTESIKELAKVNPEEYKSKIDDLNAKLLALMASTPEIKPREYASVYLKTGEITKAFESNTTKASYGKKTEEQTKALFEDSWAKVPEKAKAGLVKDVVYSKFIEQASIKRNVRNENTRVQDTKFTIQGPSDNFIEAIGTSFWNGMEQGGLAFAGVYRAIDDIFGTSYLKLRGINSEEEKNLFKGYKEYIAARPSYQKSHEQDNKVVQAISNGVLSISEMAPTLIASAALGAVPGAGIALNAAFWGSMGYGEIYNNARDEGISAESAALGAGIGAVPYTILGMAKVENIFNVGAASFIGKAGSKNPFMNWTYVLNKGIIAGLKKFQAKGFSPAAIDKLYKVAANPFIQGANSVVVGSITEAGQTFVQEMTDVGIRWIEDTRLNTDTLAQAKAQEEILSNTMEAFYQSLLPIAGMVGAHRSIISLRNSINAKKEEVFKVSVQKINEALKDGLTIPAEKANSVLTEDFENKSKAMNPEDIRKQYLETADPLMALSYIINRDGSLKDALINKSLEISFVKPDDTIKTPRKDFKIGEDIAYIYYNPTTNTQHMFLNTDSFKNIDMLKEAVIHEGLGHFLFMGDNSPLSPEMKYRIRETVDKLSQKPENGFWTEKLEGAYRKTYKDSPVLEQMIIEEKVTSFLEKYDFEKFKENGQMRLMWNDVVRWLKENFSHLFGKMTDEDVLQFVRDTHTKFKNKAANKRVELQYKEVPEFITAGEEVRTMAKQPAATISTAGIKNAANLTNIVNKAQERTIRKEARQEAFNFQNFFNTIIEQNFEDVNKRQELINKFNQKLQRSSFSPESINKIYTELWNTIPKATEANDIARGKAQQDANRIFNNEITYRKDLISNVMADIKEYFKDTKLRVNDLDVMRDAITESVLTTKDNDFSKSTWIASAIQKWSSTLPRTSDVIGNDLEKELSKLNMTQPKSAYEHFVFSEYIKDKMDDFNDRIKRAQIMSDSQIAWDALTPEERTNYEKEYFDKWNGMYDALEVKSNIYKWLEANKGMKNFDDISFRRTFETLPKENSIRIYLENFATTQTGNQLETIKSNLRQLIKDVNEQFIQMSLKLDEDTNQVMGLTDRLVFIWQESSGQWTENKIARINALIKDIQNSSLKARPASKNTIAALELLKKGDPIKMESALQELESEVDRKIEVAAKRVSTKEYLGLLDKIQKMIDPKNKAKREVNEQQIDSLRKIYYEQNLANDFDALDLNMEALGQTLTKAEYDATINKIQQNRMSIELGLDERIIRIELELDSLRKERSSEKDIARQMALDKQIQTLEGDYNGYKTVRALIKDNSKYEEFKQKSIDLIQRSMDLNERGLRIDASKSPTFDDIAAVIDASNISQSVKLAQQVVTRVNILRRENKIKMSDDMFTEMQKHVNEIQAQYKISIVDPKNFDYQDINDLMIALKTGYQWATIHLSTGELNLIQEYTDAKKTYQDEVILYQNSYQAAIDKVTSLTASALRTMPSYLINGKINDINEIIKTGKTNYSLMQILKDTDRFEEVIAGNSELRHIETIDNTEDSKFKLFGRKVGDMLAGGLMGPQNLINFFTRFKDSWHVNEDGSIFRDVSVVMKNTYDRFLKGMEKSKLLSDEINKDIHTMIDPLISRKAELIKTKMEFEVDELDVMGDTKANKIKREFSLVEMMKIYVHSKNVDSYSHLIAKMEAKNTGEKINYKLNDKTIEDITKYLEANQVEIKDILDNFMNYLSSKMYRITNTEFKKVNGFDLPHVTDYFPINRLSDQYMGSQIESEFDARAKTKFAKATGNISAIKARVKMSNVAFQRFDDLFESIDQYVKDAVHYASFKEIGNDLTFYLSKQDKSGKGGWGDKLATKPEMYKALLDWRDNVITGGTGITDPKTRTEMMAGKLRRYAMTQLLVFNIPSAMRNFASYFTGTATCKLEDRAITTTLLASNPLDFNRICGDASWFMNDRMLKGNGSFNIEAQQLIEKFGPKFNIKDIESLKYFLTTKEGAEALYGKAAWLGMYPTMIVDQFSANASFMTNYIKVLRSKGIKDCFYVDANGKKQLVKDADAQAYADDIVRKTQTLGDVRYAARWFASDNVVMQLFTPFLRTMNMQSNYFATLVGESIYHGDKRLQNMFAMVMAGPVAGLFMTCLDGNVLPLYSGKEEDKDKSTIDIAKQQLDRYWARWLKNSLDQAFVGLIGPNMIYNLIANGGVDYVKELNGEYRGRNVSTMERIRESFTPMVLRYLFPPGGYSNSSPWVAASMYASNFIPLAPSIARATYNYNNLYPMTDDYTSIFYGNMWGRIHTNYPATWAVSGAERLESLDEWMRIYNHKFPESTWYPDKHSRTLQFKENDLEFNVNMTQEEYSDLINKESMLLSITFKNANGYPQSPVVLAHIKEKWNKIRKQAIDEIKNRLRVTQSESYVESKNTAIQLRNDQRERL